jgi:hypothetical protein
MKIKIKDGGNIGNVQILTEDGIDLAASAKAYTITHRVGELPIVTLELIADIEIEAEAEYKDATSLADSARRFEAAK